jgi:hypothetical protein
MIGREGKRLLATALGLKKSAGAHVIDAQLIKPNYTAVSALA